MPTSRAFTDEQAWAGRRVHTIGHSTRPLDELVARLHEHAIVTLADIRTVPRSRHNPQYETASLRQTLPRAGIAYVHLPRLGGLRHARPDSPNRGWRNPSFRGYADHMLTDDFARGLAELAALAAPMAIMCAEAVPWRCHRSLVADALTARGAEVMHIMSAGKISRHRLTRFARVEGTRVTYPADEATIAC